MSIIFNVFIDTKLISLDIRPGFFFSLSPELNFLFSVNYDANIFETDIFLDIDPFMEWKCLCLLHISRKKKQI